MQTGLKFAKSPGMIPTYKLPGSARENGLLLFFRALICT